MRFEHDKQVFSLHFQGGDDAHLMLINSSNYGSHNKQYNYFTKLLIKYGIDQNRIQRSRGQDLRDNNWVIQFSSNWELDEVMRVIDGFSNDSACTAHYSLNTKEEMFTELTEKVIRNSVKYHQSSYQSNYRLKEISKATLAVDTNSLKDIFDKAVNRYNTSRRNRFTFFGLIQRSSSQRNEAIDELKAALETYKSNYWSTSKDEGKQNFLSTVIGIRNKVQENHLKGSRFAAAGYTQSGLVQELDNALTKCVEQGIFTEEAVKNLQQKPVAYNPTRIATLD